MPQVFWVQAPAPVLPITIQSGPRSFIAPAHRSTAGIKAWSDPADFALGEEWILLNPRRYASHGSACPDRDQNVSKKGHRIISVHLVQRSGFRQAGAMVQPDGWAICICSFVLR